MSEAITTQCVLFPSIFHKPVFASFDQENGSSDGGAVLLKAADDRLGLIRGMAGSVADSRQPGKVAHSLRELLAQRIFAIAMGYPGDAESLPLEMQQKEYAPRERKEFKDFVWSGKFGNPMPFTSRVKRALEGN